MPTSTEVEIGTVSWEEVLLMFMNDVQTVQPPDQSAHVLQSDQNL